MGIGLRSGRVGVGWMTVFGLLGLLFAVWGGQFLPQFPAIESWFRHDQKWLAWAVDDLRLRGLRAAGLVAAHSARLSEHFSEAGNGRGARDRGDPDPSDAANAGAFALHRWDRSCLCRTGFSLRLHHDRLRRGFRFSLADRIRHDAENAGTRIAHSRHRLRRDGDRDDGRADGVDRGLRARSRANTLRSTRRARQAKWWRRFPPPDFRSPNPR